MLMARRTLCQLPMTSAMAVGRVSTFAMRLLEPFIPSVPSDSVASFCSRASICDATAALRSRSSLRLSSSAFFSLTRATRAGDWFVDAVGGAIEGCRMCEDIDLVEYDMMLDCVVVFVGGS